ncbi:MAG: acyltransferase, partial [Planctomycetota bacterium]
MAARFQKGFVPELDGLRAFAVLAVLWSHLPAGALGSTVTALGEEYVVGNVGVDLFFVLSGFLITRILLVDREREVPLRWFLARRFLRIFPIYYLTIAVVSPRLTSFET